MMGADAGTRNAIFLKRKMRKSPRAPALGVGIPQARQKGLAYSR
jgi:hypothetical protein